MNVSGVANECTTESAMRCRSRGSKTMNNQYTTATEYKHLMTVFGFSDATIIQHEIEGEMEIKVSTITKQDLEQMSENINSVKPAFLRVIITETNPEGDFSERTYNTADVAPENGIDIENMSELFPEKQKTTNTEKTLFDVKEKYVNGEISMLEFESQLEEVLDPEPIAID